MIKVSRYYLKKKSEILASYSVINESFALSSEENFPEPFSLTTRLNRVIIDYFTSTWDLLLFLCSDFIVLLPNCLVNSNSIITGNLVSIIIHRVKISTLLVSAVPDAIEICSERKQVCL